MKTEDGAIIFKCLNGDREAFAFLVDKYKAAIYSYVCAKIGNMDDAEDITQEVFIKAYKDLPRLRRWDSFAHWLYAIASCRCRNWKRAKSRRPDNEFIEDQEPAKLEKLMSEPAIESYKNNELDETLHEALNQLPEIYREVLMLYYMGGMNSEQIANVLMKTPDSIRQRLSRARALLKEELVAMMSTTLPKHKLQASFTFRIVETIKKIKINPFSDIRGLPWGLSLATGIFIAVMSFSNNLPQIIELGDASGFPLPMESQVSKIGEIPVSLMKISDTTILSNYMRKADNGESKKPDIQNAFMAPQGEGEWTKKVDMPTARSMVRTAVVDGKIYAIGGRDWGGPITNVEEYDPIKDKWEIRASMPQGKYYLDVSSVNGKIYVFGGFDAKFNASFSVYEYDPILDKWRAKEDFPKVCPYIGGACALNSKIYFYGYNKDNGKSNVYEYDPAEDSLTEKTETPTKRSCMGACSVNGKAYFIGGTAGPTTVEEYDPVTDTLKKKSDMPTARIYLAVCAVGTKIYAIGGNNNGNQASPGLATVEIYDVLTDTWTKGADMQIPKWVFAASAVDGKIYSIGGFHGDGGQGGNILSAVEEFDTGFISESVDPSGKLPNTWGTIKR
jgi:RNA polymerase sigma factor (sigma-70 family)